MMSDFLEITFWICLALGIYPYAIYPFLAAVMAKVRSRPVQSGAITPRVTVVISAYNEAKHIEATVLNKLEQDYPSELLDVIVASDGSTDGTDEILKQLVTRTGRVKYFRQEPRAGKTAALNSLVERAAGEIVVFSDANSMYRADTIRHLVRSFADPAVGYVTGKMVYVNPDGSLVGDGCSAYMRLENWLRDRETRLGSIVGVDGGVDAVRKVLYRPMRADQLPDFVLPLKVVEQGSRVVFEPTAVLTEDTLTDESAEYRMRVRVTLRAFWALRDQRVLLNFLRFGVFSWQLASHKVLRYMSFVPLAIAAVVAPVLWNSGPLYRLVGLGEVVFCGLALLAWTRPGIARHWALARYCHYFVLLNIASAVAFVRFLRGEKQVIWQPRVG